MFSRLLRSSRQLFAFQGRRTAVSGIDSMPMEAVIAPRRRTQRGGPRTPLPIVGLIAICAGIGVAYINQIGRATQATYQASQLQADQASLRAEASRLDDQLDRLRATERIVAAAQQLGMRPPARWAYVSAQPLAVVTPPRAALAATPAPSDPLQGFIAALGGAVGVRGGVSIP